MDERVKNTRRRQAPVARVGGALAWVALGLPLFALLLAIPGGTAAGQSAVTLGSTLDQPPINDSPLFSGGFRLDGPSEPARYSETDGDPHAGATSLGLQIYGSEFSLAPRPTDDSPPAPPLGSGLTRP